MLMENKYKTIQEALEGKPPDGKTTLVSKHSEHTLFTPFIYDAYKNQWIGLQRWYGGNKKELKWTTKDSTRAIWKFHRVMPKLPHNHPLQFKIKRTLNIVKRRNEIIV